MPVTLESLVSKVRVRLDDVNALDQEFTDTEIENHIQNSLDLYDWSLPLESVRDGQLIVIETMIRIVTAMKLWADGDSYSYKNDAIQVTRGLLSKHYLDTIKLLREERLDLLGMDGGFA